MKGRILGRGKIDEEGKGGKSLVNQFNHCHYLMKVLLQLIVM